MALTLSKNCFKIMMCQFNNYSDLVCKKGPFLSKYM